MNIGLTHTSTLEVTDEKTAVNLGSGDLPVLATPAMLALMENAAMLAGMCLFTGFNYLGQRLFAFKE